MNNLSTFFALFIFSSASLAQTCLTNIVSDTPNSRYTMNNNGTVVDNKTGLMWMRCAVGQTWSNGTCTGSVNNLTWQNALQTAENTSFAGFSDWRLPNKKELRSIIKSECTYPAINISAFPNATSHSFWSSSPHPQLSNYTWGIYFSESYDYADRRDNSHAVRLVRGGE